MTDLEIFHNAPANASAEQLATYLDKACGGDVELRAKVEQLFALSYRKDDYLERPPLDLDAPTIGPGGQHSGKKYSPPPARPSASPVPTPKPVSEQAGDVIGPFTLIEKLGEGGFGTVWKAEQKIPFARTVALKVIKLGMDTREVLTRFEAERQALARMDHANIAKVLDAGATDNGRPFFVMELVNGIPITRHCDEHQLDTRQRLELFRGVCAALNHAHQKGMIHRDIKPSNVMVADQDGEPVVKVIDFGIAKATEGKLTEDTLVTLQEQVVGTPAYMSPEQAGMDGLDIDTRSDIYSLGVLLYELLSGKPPFDPKTLMSAGFDEMRRIIREQEPARPSNRVHTIVDTEETANITATHGVDPHRLSRILRGDLDWIVMKALEKDRGRRYETANAFAADIERFLTNETVSAAAPSLGYQFRKFARRNQAALLVSSAIAVVLVAATIVSVRQAIRANDAQQTAEENSKELRHQLYDSDMMRASQAMSVPGGLTSALAINEKWAPENGENDLRGWEWYYQRSTEVANTRSFFFPGEDENIAIVDMQWFPDSRRFLAMAGDSVMIWDFKTRMRLARIENGGALGIAIDIHPDGDRLAIVWDNEEVTVHSSDQGEELAKFSVTQRSMDIAWRTGEHEGQLVTVGKKGMEYWNWESGAPIRRNQLLPIGAFPTFSPDSEFVAYLTPGNMPSLHVVETESGSKASSVELREGWRFRRLRWHPRGTAVCVISVWGNSYVIDQNDNPKPRSIPAEGSDADWTTDEGTLIWAPHARRALEFRDPAAPRELHRFLNTGSDLVDVVDASPDNSWLLTAHDGSNRILAWPLTSEGRVPVTLKGRDITGPDEITWHPNAKRKPGSPIFANWNRASTSVASEIDFWWASHSLASADWHPDGIRLALLHGYPDSLIEVRDEQLGFTEFRASVPGGVRWTGWNANGSRLAVRTQGDPGSWIIYEADSYRKILQIPVNASGIWLPDNNSVLLSEHHRLWIANSETGAVERTVVTKPVLERADVEVEGGEPGRSVLALSPDGSMVASGSFDRPVVIRDTSTWEEVHTLWHGEPIQTMAWSPDGERLAVGTDISIRLWDPKRGSEVLKINEMGAAPIRWSPDGVMILNGTRDESSAYLWDTRAARREEQHKLFQKFLADQNWSAAAQAAQNGLTTYQRANDSPWFHAGWWQSDGLTKARFDSPAATDSSALSPTPLTPPTWIPVKSEADGVIPVDVINDKDTPLRTYLSRYYIAEKTTVKVCLDVSAPCDIRLGDESIFANESHQPPGRFERQITLDPGWNDFRVYLPQPYVTTELQLRLTVPDAAIMPVAEIELVASEELTGAQRRQRVQKLIDKHPGDASSWRKLVKVELYHNNPDEAADALRQAFELEPDHYEAMGLLARLSLVQAEAKENAGKPAEPAELNAAWAARIIHAAEAGFFPAQPPSQNPPNDESSSTIDGDPFQKIISRQPSDAATTTALEDLAAWLPNAIRQSWLKRWQTAFNTGSDIKPASDPDDWYRRACVLLLSNDHESGIQALRKYSDLASAPLTRDADHPAGTPEHKTDRIYELAQEEALRRFQTFQLENKPGLAEKNLAQAILLATDASGSEQCRKRRAQAITNFAVELGDSARQFLDNDDFEIKTAAASGHCLALFYSKENLSLLLQLDDFRETNHEQIGYTLLKLGNLLGGKIELESNIAFKEAARRIALLEPESHLLLYVDHSLGSDYANAERFADSVAVRESALRLAREYRGNDDSLTLGLLWSLARSYEKAERFDEAITLARELVAHNSEINGPDNRHTISASNELIRFLEATGDTAGADAVRETLPSPLSNTLRQQIKKAIALAHGNDSEQVVRLWSELQSEIAALAPLDQVTALSEIRAVAIEFTRKRIHPDTTLAIRHAFITACETAHGPNYHQTLYGKIGLAETLETLERLDEAMTLRLDAMQRAVEHHHVNVEFHARNGLANLLQREGRHEEALPHYRLVLARAREHREPDDQMTRSILVRLTGTLEALDRIDEALARAEEWLAIETRISGIDHPKTLQAKNTVARYRELAVAGKKSIDDAVGTNAPE